jgi:pimeloyl-ACP methyl ester carboxylesterase
MLVALALAPVTATGSASAARWHGATSRAPILRPAASVALARCGIPGARCGTVRVALDPGDPAAGTIPIRFELHGHRDRARPALGTIVAVEGGPGYSTRASRDYYLELFDPLLDRRDLLLVDNRGTGASGAINCKLLQSYLGDYTANVGHCGRKLGSRSDLYGTAFAADDLAAVLDALEIERIDLYGDSYGTFFAQSFAVRHPDRVRTVVLDAAYPVEDQDAWYRDLNRALRDAFRFACARDRGCAALGGDPIDRMRDLVDELRARPLTGDAADADGEVHSVTVDAGMLGYLAASAAYGFPVYRELDAAGRAYFAGDSAPLLRIAAEQTLWGDAGPYEEYSEGLYVAVACNDYPQLWDISSPVATRAAQYDDAVADLRATEPDAFDPFTVDDWIASPWTEYRSCIEWPEPSTWMPPVPDPADYPDVPTLVFAGDLDSLTSPEGAQLVAGRFPDATYVEIRNGVHVMALVDYSRCASVIVRRFVRTRDAGDTSCAAEYNEVRMVEEFPELLADVTPPPQVGKVASSDEDRRRVSAAMNTVADLFPRWFSMFGYDGVGLRGGSFHTEGYDEVAFRMDRMRWVEDLKVSGYVTHDRTTGRIHAEVRVRDASDARGNLTITWNDRHRNAAAHVIGQIDGRPVNLWLRAS